MDALDFLYNGNAGDISNVNYNPPAHFPHGKWVLVGSFNKEKGSDGQDVEIYEEKWPASFFKVVVKDTENSLGKVVRGFVLGTGSGSEVGELAFEIGQSIADGMLGLNDN